MTELEIYLRELVEKRVIHADVYDDIMYLAWKNVKVNNLKKLNYIQSHGGGKIMTVKIGPKSHERTN